MAIIPLLVWILYFLVPSEGGIVHGIPAGRIEAIGLLLVIWIAAHRVRLIGAWAAAAVAIAAVITSAAVPGAPGLNARYFATASADGTHERSIENRDARFTRIDDRIDFVRDDRDFHLAFFNDHTRFNFMRPGEPDRRALEFAVAWTGWFWADGAETFYVHAPKSSAQVSIDTQSVFSTTPASAEESRELQLNPGWHRLHITFSSPYGAPREFSAGVIRSGVHQPFDRTMVRSERADQRQRVAARGLATGKTIADLISLAWLGGLATLLLLRRLGEVWQRRQPVHQAVIALFVAGGAIEALRFAWPWADRFRNMIAGDDPMTYEGYARDILFNGILMDGGLPAGQGQPFYYQALYPYFLAATHAVFGEGFFGALFLQRLFVALTAVALTRIAIKLRGEAVWPLALLVSALFTYGKLAPIAADLLNESLYIPLLVAWAASLMATTAQPSVWRAAKSGLLAGLAATTRSTLTLSWVAVWPACAFRWWTMRQRTSLVTMIACSMAVYSLIAVRNGIVSGQFAASPTGMGITLLGGNQPPPGIVIDVSARKSFYDRLGVGGYTAEVMEYAIVAPRSFIANLGRKALFTLGWYEPYAPGWGYSPVYIAVWTSAIWGLVVLARGGQPLVPMLMPLLIAITQFAAVVIVYPKGERLILPIHTLLIPYSAIAAHELWMRVARSR